MHRKMIELTGHRFGLLTVIEVSQKTNHGTKWLCRCDCGNAHVASVSHLRSGDTSSCGCFNSEKARQRRLTHGAAPMRRNGGPTREYRIWCSMKKRCYDAKQKCYHLYGGRGISVCDRWVNDFPAFLSDMGPCPSPRHSLDRFPDQNGNYTLINCRWATPQQQARNRRGNRLIEYKQETLTLQEWSERLCVPYKTLWSFLKKKSFPEAVSFFDKTPTIQDN